MQKQKMRDRTRVHRADDLTALHEDLGTEVIRNSSGIKYFPVHDASNDRFI
jgi:hypothetical protein